MALDIIASFLKVGASLIGLIAGVFIAHHVDTRYFPPIENFTIEAKIIPPMSLNVRGSLVWARDCEFKYVRMYATAEQKPSIMLAELDRASVTKNAPTDVGIGVQPWGPFTSPIGFQLREYDYVEIIGMFRCHALWQQTQQLAKLSIKEME